LYNAERKGSALAASGLVVAHNHPSGNLNPSESDSKITAEIKEATNKKKTR
jgi:DNA repair protein RadC